MIESAEPVRTREEVIDFSEKEVQKPSRTRWMVAAVLAVIIAVLLWGYPGFLRTSPVGEERAALAYFNDGNYSEAIRISQNLVKKYPDRVLSHLILGNIYLTEGNKEKAHQHYQDAIGAGTGSPSQKAKAMIGLGRIASAGNNPNEALGKYRQAAALDPENAQAYVSQAVILAEGNNYDDALKLLIRAKTLAPNEPSIDAVIADTRKKTELIANREKRERIDRLVSELLNNLEKSNKPELSDRWTSVPLTVWLMELNSTGYSLYEGENRIVHSGISHALIERSRTQVVERALLDKLMEELKLGTSKLADPQTALSLGKILAAKVIVSGQIFHQGPQTQASLRVIETETGEVSAAVNQTFAGPVSSSRLAEDLSNALIARFNTLYPLRGIISQIEGKEVFINIGQRQGVKEAQRFKVMGTDVVIEISSVQADRSIAVIEPDEAVLSAGQRIELF
jgi:tetratricopeptide (TPR) repeat protein